MRKLRVLFVGLVVMGLLTLLFVRKQRLWGQTSSIGTVLLFNFVSNQSNLDTGIVISNTTMDPLGTTPTPGSCTLYYYGNTFGGVAPPPQITTLIQPGTQLIFSVSSGGSNGVAATPGFQGSIIAKCDFQYASGTSAVTDLGATKYLSVLPAIELNRMPPTANAGQNQSVDVGAKVGLDGTGSSDPNQNPITYYWSFSKRPVGSIATLTGVTTSTPSFVPDVAGTYVIQLVVSNIYVSSVPSTVTITATSVFPTAVAGSNQTVAVPANVLLDGSASSSSNGRPLTYSWSFASKPAASTSLMVGANLITPTFYADVVGTYVVQLIVNDGLNNSPASMVTITAVPAGTRTMSFSPLSTTINGAVTQNLALNLSIPASASLAVNLSSSNPSVVSVPAAVTFAPNTSTVIVPVTGVAAGSAIITATASGIAPAAASVTVNISTGGGGNGGGGAGSSGPVVLSSLSLGQNLQTVMSLSLPQAAPSGGQQVTLTSGDSTKVLLSPNATSTGAGTLTINIPQGLTLARIYVQGLVSSGTVTVSADAGSQGTGTATITLTPSGFLLVGPGGVGTSTFSSNQGVSSTLEVAASRLDSTFAFAEGQQVRGGLNVSVNVTSSNTSVGTISPASVAFSGGNDTLQTTFNAINTGSTTITAAPPSGFSTIAQSGNVLTASVTPAGIVLPNVTVGQSLETSANVILNGSAPASGLSVAVTSNSPSKMLLSTSPAGPWTTTIYVAIQPNFLASPNFYIEGLASSGTATYTATATGFPSATGTVTFAPSGIVIAGPGGLGQASFTTTPGAPTSTITVFSVLLDSSNNVLAGEPVANPVTVTVTSSNTSVGTISASPVVIAAAMGSASTQFQPGGNGTTAITPNVPAGFTAPAQYTSVSATISTAGIAITDQVAVGQNLEIEGLLTLGEPAPAGGVVVTLTSADPTRLLLSANPGDPGSSLLKITVAAGTNHGTYYIQGLGNSGTVTYTATASGFRSRTATVTLAPSGVVLSGPLGFDVPFPFTTSVADGPTPIGVFMAILDPTNGNTLLDTQQLRGGLILTVSLTVNNPSVGTIDSTVTFNGGDDGETANFTPLSHGAVTISVVTPTTIVTGAAGDNTTVPITVN